MSKPVSDANRIESLDVLRGFALLGILLLNILGFGLHSAAYSNPGFDLSGELDVNLVTYVTVELFGEGAMRALFSMLFGAGVVLFTTGDRTGRGWLHYKRTFWLLMFGLFDAFILLWTGDILVTYALAGAFLYLMRNVSAARLLAAGTVLLIIISVFYGGSRIAIDEAREAATLVADAQASENLNPAIVSTAAIWDEFKIDFVPTNAQVEEEYAARRDSYASAFTWTIKKNIEMLTFIIPVFLFWDALAMMLIGMALYKYGVLSGTAPGPVYFKLMIFGFGIGLAANGFEVFGAIASDLDLIHVFAQMQPSYHVGRVGMAMGYIGLLVWLTRQGHLTWVRTRLADVGKMALTNYLLHSFFCLLIFTGAGLSLVGELSRAALYPIVFTIWGVQLVLSPWWLRRFRFGPVEWLWRALTYGERPPFRRM